jgi:hypothetical protein
MTAVLITLLILWCVGWWAYVLYSQHGRIRAPLFYPDDGLLSVLILSIAALIVLLLIPLWYPPVWFWLVVCRQDR